MVPTFQRFQDFRNRYMNKYVWKETNTGLGKVPAGNFWLSDPGRITYDSVTFKPNEPQVLPGKTQRRELDLASRRQRMELAPLEWHVGGKTAIRRIIR